MEVVRTIMEGVLRYLGTIALTDWLDIALLAYLLYRALKLVGRSRAASLGRGVLVFLLALALSDVLRLNSINWILRNIVTVGALALIVLFQPEIRRLLEQVGSSRLSSFNPFARVQQTSVIETAIAQTVDACAEMSEAHTGMLVVFERNLKLDDIARTGTIVDAQVSSQLLKNIFFVKAAMHDGAVIIRDGRLLAGGCILPLSHNANISRDLGTRHRAGIGMSENSDAVVVIVSEETGAISVAIRGMLKRHLTAQTLEKLLTNELLPAPEEQETQDKFRLRLPWQRKAGKEADGDADE
ncbi:MAG: diadenylate cyclase CdaA [Oscillospiraceae bacterium]|nr:diadenylate cyclase CdaA [Oscillospiraceae bacterium]